MPRNRPSLTTAPLLVFAFFALAIFNASALTTNRWTNVVSSLWSVSTNWSAAVPPSTSFDFTVITNTGTKTVTLDSSAATANRAIKGLTVSAPIGFTNTLLITDITNPVFATASRPLTVGARGILQITNSILSIGDLFDVSAGTVILDSGSIDTTPTFVNVRLGRLNGGTGTMTLNGGTLLTFGLTVGALANSPGILTVNGGKVISSSVTSVGETSGSTGTVAIVSGEFIATNDITKVGNLSGGLLTQSSGSSAFSWLSVGDNSSGTIEMSGGQLLVRSNGVDDLVRVGNFGTGQLNISGGTTRFEAEFHLADNPSVNGIVRMTGGLLFATNALVAIGRYGIGQMTVSNASAWLTNASVGRHLGAIGTLTLRTGGTVTCLDDLSIGRFAGAEGHVIVSGGLLSAVNQTIWAGREGMGDLTVSSGLVKGRSLFVGKSEDGSNAPQGSVTVSGGTTLLSSNVIVGTDLLSTGLVSVSAGTLAVTNSSGTGLVVISNGTFTLNQGSVIADCFQVIGTNSVFNFAGGTLQAGCMAVSNGAPFVVGDGVQPATLLLTGGTYSFADGLVISSNATVTGCGTIVGTVLNSGILNTNCTSGGITIKGITKNGNVVTVTFSTLAGTTNVLEYNNSLGDPWTPILPGVPGDGSETNAADTNATAATRFYRIHTQ